MSANFPGDVYSRMECYDDQFVSPLDWYLNRAQQLNIVSPERDGTNQQLLMADLEQDSLTKADVTSGDTGVYNPVYSLGVFIQYITSHNVLGALKNESWKTLGYRSVTTASKSSGIGVAEAASVGTAVEPTYAHVGPTPKEIELVSSFSSRMQVLGQIADAIKVDENRQVIEADFMKSLATDILQDNDTLAGDNFESIDRIVGSYSEITGVGQTAGDLDIYSLDRDAGATWTDANVLHNSGSDRTLSIALIDQLWSGQVNYWTTPGNKFYITDADTIKRWSQLEASKQRYGHETFSMTVGDGIKTDPGRKGGFLLSTWDGLPIVRDPSVQSDTISRIYLLDSDFLGITWGRPIEYLETDHPFMVGHAVKGMWYGIGEAYCNGFKMQGKLRDLS